MSLLLAQTASDPILWENLGLRPGIDLGFFTLRFYALAYLGGIILGYWHLTKMIEAPGAPMAKRHAEDLFFYCTLGIILGGRLGYSIFYMPSLWENPLDVLKTWEGGMSFHGGVIGVLVAITWVCWRNKLSFLRVCDYISVNVAFGMLFGRLANFINGELWGRPVESDVPWAMVFPGGGEIARHPSQLYQAGFEGLALVIIMLLLFWKTRARFRPGLLVAVFTIGMGLARFVNEFFREPDAHLVEFARETGLSMGQWLSIPMIIVGLVVVVIALRQKPLASGAGSSGTAVPAPASNS
ncbi:prolipoprotein diacylglyceryl transferase [Altererythrobacter sp. MF3-039]|uniref:prolipoprotein diacylglyceryl transferase n=1 Tax=Altererythrobacter sp. MF3-039 TaxID=3252901 RepID=UPI00390C79A5